MSVFILIETNTIFIKLIFFDVFMHFELRWYADFAFQLLVEVWDSSAGALTIAFINVMHLVRLMLTIVMQRNRVTGHNIVFYATICKSDMFKPSSFKAVLLLWILFVIYDSCLSCYTILSVPCSLVVAFCERADLLTLLWVMFACVFVTFQYGAPGQVWYSIVSIADLYLLLYFHITVRKNFKAKIRNRYNQAPHLTQDTNGKVTNSQLDITNESQEVSPFPAGDHKATINRRAQKHNKHTTEITWKIHKRSNALERSVKLFYWRALTSFTLPTSLLILMCTRTHLRKWQNTTLLTR